MTPIRIVLADDHTLLRVGLRALLTEIPEVHVVGEATEGRAALAQVETLRPEILLADISMPGLNGLEVAARVAQDYPETKRLSGKLCCN
jgi:DNA-binding NarL/FixJ family response regulator